MADSEEKIDRGADMDSTVSVLKDRMISGQDPMDVEGSNQASVDESNTAIFNKAGAIEPPYSPFMLCRLFEHSEGLRPPIDSYCVNIDGFGFQLEPAFDLESEDDRRILAMTLKKSGSEKGSIKGLRKITAEVRKAFRTRMSMLRKSGDDDNTDNGTPVPDNSEIRDKFGEDFAGLADDMAEERARIMNFFEACCPDMSFVKLRRNTRQDLEITGNGYWEIIRNGAGEVSQFIHIPAFTMRLMPLTNPIVVGVPIRQNDLTYKEAKRRKRFRRFVQVLEEHKIFFKEFGDPRTMSARTGKFFDSPEEMARIEGEDSDSVPIEATEVMHFKIDSPRSSYGVPRWIGALLSVFGSRMANEINFLYFDNKSVPPLAMLVSGGHLTKNSVSRIEDYVKNNLQGRTNFHKILILEAEPAQGTTQGDASRVKIELRPLTSAQHSDGMFQKYDERNLDKIGNMFRLPRLLRGDIRDFNRSTAMAALNFTEMQVFQPEREDFDFIINREIFADLRVRFWSFESRAPVTRDPTAMSTMIKEQTNSGNLVPAEARELLEDVFNRTFRKINEPWTKQPLPLTLAGVSGGVEGFANGVAQPKKEEPEKEGTKKSIVENVIEELFRAKQVAEKLEQTEYDNRLPKILKESNEGYDEPETIVVPLDEWESMVEIVKENERVPSEAEAGGVQRDT